MPEMIIQLIIIMLVCGFAYYVWTLVRPLLPIAGAFAQAVDILVLILVAAIILFYAVIPILKMLPRLLH